MVSVVLSVNLLNELCFLAVVALSTAKLQTKVVKMCTSTSSAPPNTPLVNNNKENIAPGSPFNNNVGEQPKKVPKVQPEPAKPATPKNTSNFGNQQRKMLKIETPPPPSEPEFAAPAIVTKTGKSTKDIIPLPIETAQPVVVKEIEAQANQTKVKESGSNSQVFYTYNIQKFGLIFPF